MANKPLTEKELNKQFEIAKARLDAKVKQINQFTINEILNGVVWPETRVDAATRKKAADYLRSVMMATANGDYVVAKNIIDSRLGELKAHKSLNLLQKMIKYIKEFTE